MPLKVQKFKVAARGMILCETSTSMKCHESCGPSGEGYHCQGLVTSSHVWFQPVMSGLSVCNINIAFTVAQRKGGEGPYPPPPMKKLGAVSSAPPPNIKVSQIMLGTFFCSDIL